MKTTEYTEKSLSILKASRKLFAARGYKAVTTKEIAAESGVNEITIFRHFQNKDNLFKQMLVYFISKPNVSEFINEENSDLEAFLYGIGNLIHTIFVENLDLFKIELVERQKIQSMNLINKFPNEIKKKMIHYLMNHHQKTEGEAAIYSISFMTGVHGLCMNLYFLKTFTPIPDFNECLDLLVERFR